MTSNSTPWKWHGKTYVGAIHGAIGHRVLPDASRMVSEGPILFGGHGCPVAFRNIWLKPLP